MKKLEQDELSFGLIELVIIIVIIGTLGFAGWFVWQKHSNQSSTNPSKIGWLTYRSTHSSAEFQYPANWKLTKGTSRDDKYAIESVTITGTNHFVIQYSLDKTNHTPMTTGTYNCPANFGTKVFYKLSSSLEITSYLSEGIQLISTGSIPNGYGYTHYPCNPGSNYVALPNDEYVTLYGDYVSGSLSYGAENTVDILKQPEVKLAVDILKSFKT